MDIKGRALSELLELLRSMNVDDFADIKIKKIFKLGFPNGKTKKFAPVLVTFGDQAQRNNILKAGSRLPEGVSMEKDIPRAYRETYSKFKKHAWRLRAFYGVKTKIIFVSHVLTLRYKEENKAFTIVLEYVPPSNSLPIPKSGNLADRGPPSTIIPGNGFSDDSSKSLIFVPNRKIDSKDDLYTLISPHISERASRETTNAKEVGKNLIIYTETADAATRIVKYLDGKDISGSKVHAEHFGFDL